MSSGVQPVFNLNEKTGGGFGGSEWLWVVVLFVLLGGGVFWHPYYIYIKHVIL